MGNNGWCQPEPEEVDDDAGGGGWAGYDDPFKETRFHLAQHMQVFLSLERHLLGSLTPP